MEGRCFTCEVHNQKFKTLEELKEHDRELHTKKLSQRKGKSLNHNKKFKAKTDIIILSSRKKFPAAIIATISKLETKQIRLEKPKIQNKGLFQFLIIPLFQTQHLESHLSNGEKLLQDQDIKDTVKSEISFKIETEPITEVISYYDIEIASASAKNQNRDKETGRKNRQNNLKDGKKDSKSLVRNPIDNKSNQKKWTCYFCDLSFKFYLAMERHLFLHTFERPFGCRICNKSFRNTEQFNKHRAFHRKDDLKDRQFVCKICKCSFKESSILARHYLTHSEEKKNVCKYCKKAYKRPGDLRRHILCSHSAKTPFKCKLCSCEYNRKDVYKLHMKTVHANESKSKFKQLYDLYNEVKS